MSYKQYANKIFLNITESMTIPKEGDPLVGDGIVTSVEQYISLIGQIILNAKDQYGIPDTSQLIPSENFPIDLLWRINNSGEAITDSVKKDLTIVTYTAQELPAQKGAHTLYGKEGIRNIKPRLIDIFPDPKHTGYSIARVGKEIEATITFNVWGFDDKNIRDRSLLLRKIIQDNIWYLKFKGLRETVWLGANETDVWDKLNIVRYKKEQYTITFTEIQELREKNIEQVSMTIGIESEQ